MNTTLRDTLRQVVILIAACFQVIAGQIAPVAQVSADNHTLVVPADYAFAVWGPIFILSFVYAIYQALPVNRDNDLLRRIGWWFAGAALLNGIWEIIFGALRLYIVAQLVLVGLLICLAFAYGRFVLATQAKREKTFSERWLIAPLLGIFFGWITAATVVGFAITLVALGFLHGGSTESLVEAVLLLVGTALAVGAILYGRKSLVQLYLAYTLTVVWACIGVVINQRTASTVTTTTAIVTAIVVVAITLFTLLPGRWRVGKGKPSISM